MDNAPTVTDKKEDSLVPLVLSIIALVLGAGIPSVVLSAVALELVRKCPRDGNADTAKVLAILSLVLYKATTLLAGVFVAVYIFIWLAAAAITVFAQVAMAM